MGLCVSSETAAPPTHDAAAARNDAAVVRNDAGVARWLYPPTGDSQSSDWRAYRADWAEEAEAFFQIYLSQGGGGCRARRAEVSAGARGEAGAAEPSSVDFLLMTCREPAVGDRKAKVFPLRRYEGDLQTHPPPGQPHPWFLKKVQERDSSDWLNNEFFFRAFSQVMANAGHTVHGAVHDIFDFQWNQDFRQLTESEHTVRGGVMYNEPAGWKKFAVKVMGCFEGGNAWLRLDGHPGEWAVAYHGTNVDAMPSILTAGMRAGERQAYKDHKDKRTGEKIGTGIYCTPSIKTAADFSPTLEFEGRRLQFVFQCRVRPEAIKRIHEEVGRESGAYWLINNAADIRPYGVLVREAPNEP